MRISTSQFYTQSVAQMDNQQSQLNQLEQELSSGQALNTPGDNPLAAAQAVQLTMTSATITQYTSNQNTALSSLQLEDQTMQGVANVMQNINSLIARSGDGSMNDQNRAAIAQEMQGYRNQLLSLANTADGSGTYLFSGFQTNTQPFANNPAGGVTYKGDNGVRQIQVAGTQQMAVSDNGASVFMSVPPSGTSAVPASAATNTGNGTIGKVTVTNAAAATNSDSYTITFGGPPAAPTYTVTDNTAVPPTTTPAAAYTSGSAIALGAGLSVAVSGTPNAGDTFSVTPAQAPGNSNLFQTIDSMIAALNTPITGNPAAAAKQANAMTGGTAAFMNSFANITVIQASIGGREQGLQALQTTTQNNQLSTKNDLSNITSIDMAATISQFELTQNSLTAAQKSFVQLQGLSLFNYITN